MICGWVNHKKITLLWPTNSIKEFQFLASLFYRLHQHLFAICFMFKSSQLSVYFPVLLVWPMHFFIWCIWSYKDDFKQYINFDYCIGKIWSHTYNVCHVDMSQFFSCCCQRSQSRESNFKFSVISPTSASAWHLPYIKIRPCSTVLARLLRYYENFDLIW